MTGMRMAVRDWRPGRLSGRVRHPSEAAAVSAAANPERSRVSPLPRARRGSR